MDGLFSTVNFYADVILPLALPQLYTYYIPAEFAETAVPGKRVAVQFGKHKMYSALIRTVHSNKPDAYAPNQLLLYWMIFRW
jgi:primosomal protein N' (replication factor Y)